MESAPRLWAWLAGEMVRPFIEEQTEGEGWRFRDESGIFDG